MFLALRRNKHKSQCTLPLIEVRGSPLRGYFIPGCNGTGAWSHKYIYIYRCDCCIQKSCVGSALPPLSFPASFFGRGHPKPSHSRSKVSFRRLWETWGPKRSRALSIDELESFWAPFLILYQRLHTYKQQKQSIYIYINILRSLLGSETPVRLDSVWFPGSWISVLGPEPFPVPRSRVSDAGPHPGPGPGPVSWPGSWPTPGSGSHPKSKKYRAERLPFFC